MNKTFKNVLPTRVKASKSRGLKNSIQRNRAISTTSEESSEEKNSPIMIETTETTKSWGTKAADTLYALKSLVLEYKKQARQQRAAQFSKEKVKNRKLEKKLEEVRILEMQIAQEEAKERIKAQAALEAEAEKEALEKIKIKAEEFVTKERARILQKRISERERRVQELQSVLSINPKDVISNSQKPAKVPAHRHWTQYLAAVLALIAVIQMAFIVLSIWKTPADQGSTLSQGLENLLLGSLSAEVSQQTQQNNMIPAPTPNLPNDAPSINANQQKESSQENFSSPSAQAPQLPPSMKEEGGRPWSVEWSN